MFISGRRDRITTAVAARTKTLKPKEILSPRRHRENEPYFQIRIEAGICYG
jgi:hypothetical protein